MPMAEATWWVVLLLPIWGAGLVLLLASQLSDAARRLTLILGPLLVGVLTWCNPPAKSPDGLVDLAVGLFRVICLGAFTVYYLGLLVVAILGWLRRNAELRRDAREAAVEGRQPALIGHTLHRPLEIGR